MYIIAGLGIYMLLAIGLFGQVVDAVEILVIDAVIIASIGTVAWLNRAYDSKLISIIRYFYIIPTTYLLYYQVHSFVQLIHPVDYDQLFILIDRTVFGVDPTVWFGTIATPWLTEYLQICYFLFYFLPVMHMASLYNSNDWEKLDYFLRGMMFCYVISYLLYFVMPAIGPRFTLHNYALTDIELPGLYFTSLIRGLIDQGGGLMTPGVDPASMVNRDCMPSGHTMMTLVNIFLAFKFRSRQRFLFVLIGGSLIVATVYLRYHYVVDVVVGAGLAVILLPLEPIVHRWISGTAILPNSPKK